MSAERERIAAAVVELAGTRGYRSLSVEIVSEHAAVTTAEFERHFDDLEDCYCQAFEEVGQEMLLRLAGAFAAHGSWRDQLRALAYEFLDFLQEDLPRARFCGIESLFAGDRVLLLRDNVFSGLFAFIDLGRQQLDDPDSLTPATAATIGGSIFNQIRIALEREDSEALARMVPEMMYAAVLPYLGEQAAIEELTMPRPES